MSVKVSDMDEPKRGGRRLHNALTAAFVRTVTAPGRYFDGQGLFLLVEPSGAKRWKQRITVRGKRHELGLGPFPVVTLAMVREEALVHRREARTGGSPMISRRRANGVPTFEEAAHKVFELRRPGWRSAKHAGQWIGTLEDFVFPRFGARGVDEVTVDDVLAVLSPLWHSRPTTAKRVRQRIGVVFLWAVAQGLRPDNPADSVRAVLSRQPDTVKAHRALAYDEVAGAVAAVQASGATPALKLALEYLVLTAARSGEVRFAMWDEVDLEGRTWTIPASRMKVGRKHRVPLSGRAVEVLAEAQSLGEGAGLVFPTRAGDALSNTAFVQCLKRLNVDATAHGFRASFRVWAQERTNTPREVCEAALAHTIKDKSEAAYARSDLFEKRRKLMDTWASYLQAEHGHMVPLPMRREAAQ